MVDYNEMDDSVLKQQNLERVTTVEKLEERSWDRDNIGQRLEEVRNNADTIETILQDINEKIQQIPGKDELEDEWSAYLDRMDTDSKGDPKAYPAAFHEAERDRFELMLRQAIWQARLKELESFAREKVGSKFMDLLEEYRTLKSESRLDDILDVEGRYSEIKELRNQIEKMGQSFREEKRSLWEMMERVAEKEGTSLTKDEVKEAQVEGLESFVDDKQVFTLDKDRLEQAETNRERESAKDAAADSVVEEDDEELGDRERLVGNWSDYFSMMTVEDVAEELGRDEEWVETVISEEDLESNDD